ncbi:transposable element Tc1 transposase [Trichonephila clavipes]|nr:transposable element Tc1 transposase [Trichonephila clavipes]
MPRFTNARQDRIIVRQVLTTPTVSVSFILRSTASSLTSVVPYTISWRLTEHDVVWSAISYDSRLSLAILRTSLTAQRYADTILRPNVLSLVARLQMPNFQLDNVRTHTNHIFLNYLRGVNTLSWSARSPDLPPIKHIWNMIGHQILAPLNIADLEQQLMNAW